jgi:hypothetical protein
MINPALRGILTNKTFHQDVQAICPPFAGAILGGRTLRQV